MTKIDKTVIKETKYIGSWVVLLSAVMEAVFLVLGKWDYTVLLGNILTGIAGVLNFLLMGITVQKAVEKEEKAARAAMKVSQMYRTLFMLVVVIIGVVAPCFNIWAVIIPLFFPRIAIAIRPILDKAGRK
ncbi:MAG: ATP synthase subunit I [Clostridia bacterium]|nr:ATP synthase subunit I [Clostridia bacterium]